MGLSFRPAAIIAAILLLVLISSPATALTPPIPGQTPTPVPSATPAPDPTATPGPTATPAPASRQTAPSGSHTWQYSNPITITATPAPAAALASPSPLPGPAQTPTAVPSPGNNGLDTETMLIAVELAVIAAMGGFILGKRKK